MRKQAGRGIVLVALLIVAFMNAMSAGSAESLQAGTPAAEPSAVPKFGIHPVGTFPNGYFEMTIDPGKTMTFNASVMNIGTGEIDLRAFAANVENPPNGGFAATTEADPPTGPTTWIDFAATSFSLAPGKDHEFSFTVTVPEGTAPGQYVSALVARTAEAVVIPGTTAFNQVIRSAVAVVITVPGPVKARISLGTPTFNIDASEPRLIIPVSNPGNVLVKPAGELTLSTADGQIVTKSPVQMGSVYGGYSTTLEIGLPQQLTSGVYLVSVTLTDAQTKATATIDKQTVTLADRNAPPPQFTLDPVSVTATGTPIQFANVAITINNAGANIPTAKVILRVSKDDKPVEDYPLAQNQALPNGKTDITQRYIPATGWQPGTYTFAIVVSNVDSATGTETILSTTPVSGTIVVP